MKKSMSKSDWAERSERSEWEIREDLKSNRDFYEMKVFNKFLNYWVFDRMSMQRSPRWPMTKVWWRFDWSWSPPWSAPRNTDVTSAQPAYSFPRDIFAAQKTPIPRPPSTTHGQAGEAPKPNGAMQKRPPKKVLGSAQMEQMAHRCVMSCRRRANGMQAIEIVKVCAANMRRRHPKVMSSKFLTSIEEKRKGREERDTILL